MRRPYELARDRAVGRGLLGALRRDCSGATAIVLGLSMSVLVGLAALGTEVAGWYVAKRSIQTAADTAAASAATVKALGGTFAQLQTEADSVAAQAGFANSGSTTVTVNNPPASGPNQANNMAVEVIIKQPQQVLLSALFLGSNPTVAGRAVAVAKNGACAIALGTSNPAVSTSGSSSISLTNCDLDANSGVTAGGSSSISAMDINAAETCSGNVTASKKLNCDTDNPQQVSDPYAGRTIPSFSGPCTTPSGSTISAGVYCGINVSSGSSLTLQPGIYYIDGGNLSVNGSLSGSGVTIILTSSTGTSYGTVAVAGGANLNLSAPASGQTQGIALWIDKRAPSATSSLSGGSDQVINGAVYMPSQTISYAGNADTSGCGQLIAATIILSGSSSLNHNCAGLGVQEPGGLAGLVE